MVDPAVDRIPKFLIKKHSSAVSVHLVISHRDEEGGGSNQNNYD